MCNTSTSNSAENRKKNIFKEYLLPAFAIISLLIIVLCAFWIIGGDSTGFTFQQFIGILIAAVISGVITVILLISQEKSHVKLLEKQDESIRKSQQELNFLQKKGEKELKTHENKINTYADFISKMWSRLEDNEITPEEIVKIRSGLFNKLLFYLKNEQVDEITKTLNEWKENEFSNEKALTTFGKITAILRSDLSTDAQLNNLNKLWNSFSPKEPSQELYSDDSQSSQLNYSDVKENCYHFNVGDRITQYQIFANGIPALVLWECNENWRTERLKAVVPDSLIFLYQPGGAGYVGVFQAKGWICFESKGDGNISRRIEYNDNYSHIKDESLCVDEFIGEGATSVAYLMVEPLIFYEKGVGRIQVYRYTISSYDKGYARTTLSRFGKILEEHKDEIRILPKLEDKIGAEAIEKAKSMTLKCNTDAFTKILNLYDIHPAKIVNGEWK